MPNPQGLIQAAPETPEATAPTKGPQYKSKAVEAVPQELRAKFEQYVLAGMKFLYAKETQPIIKQQLAGNKPIWQRLGEGIARLIAMLDKKSQKQFPQELLIPVGLELLHEYAVFLNESGKFTVSDEDLKTGAVYTAICIARLYGAGEEQIKSMMGQSSNASQETAGTQPEQMMAQPA